jgi:hypothetical protein
VGAVLAEKTPLGRVSDIARWQCSWRLTNQPGSRERSFGAQAASLLPLECDVLTSKLIQEATFSKVS